ncbi:MAG: CBS domain-containing protein [Deltaproteobacteria bacterium]|nr:CBS domain-containing protein [Deltaproteobacteria bacterium]
MSFLSVLIKSQTVVSLPSSASVYEAAQLMAENKVGSVVVMDGDELSGIFTERDLLNRVVARGLDPKSTQLSLVMSKDVVVCPVTETVKDCFKKMEATKCRHLPVVDGKKVAGMVTMRNILEWLFAEAEEEKNQLRKYIQS